MRDSFRISPYSVTPESNIKVVTEKEDCQLKKLLIVKQILLVSTIRNVHNIMENMYTVVTVWKGSRG